MLLSEPEGDGRGERSIDHELAKHEHADAIEKVELSAALDDELGARLDEYVVDDRVALGVQARLAAQVEHATERVGGAEVEVGGRRERNARLMQPQALVARKRPVDDLRQVAPVGVVEDALAHTHPLLVALVAVGRKVVQIVHGLHCRGAEPVERGVDARCEVAELGGDLSARAQWIVEPILLDEDIA